MAFLDDNLADCRFAVSLLLRLASGLPAFATEGEVSRVDTLAILEHDLSGSALDRVRIVCGAGGYSRLPGDAADTPCTSLRRSAQQFVPGPAITGSPGFARSSGDMADGVLSRQRRRLEAMSRPRKPQASFSVLILP